MKTYYSQLNIVIFIFALIVIPSMKQGSAGFLCAQNVGINTAGASPNISAILDIDAQPGFNKGLLIPRVTYSQRIGANFNPLSAAAQGLTVYQTDAGGLGEGFYYNTSTSTTPAWAFLLNNTSGWSLTGNATTTPSTSAIGTAIAAGQNYVGTSDLKDFVLATNNLERLRISSAGNIGIGTSTPGTLLDVNGSTRALLYTFPAPTGDPAPVITTRTVPSGQGSSAEKTELILFHGNDPANAAGADQITLRAPALSFQTFNDVNVLDMNNNVGYNERMYINSIGNVGIGTILPERLLHVAVTATDGVNGAVLNSYEIAQFKVHAGGGAKRGLEIGAPTGSIVSPVYLKVHGTSNRFAILNETNAEQFTILNSGNIGIGTAAPTQKLQVSGGNIIIDNTNWYYGFNTSGAAQPLIRSRGMGYSPSTYPGLQLGQIGDNIALFIDPNSITGGAFNGNIENEIFLPNTASFRQANSGATDWISTIYLNNGNIGIGTTAPSTQLHTTGGVRFQTLTGTGNRFVITDLNGNISAGAATTAGIVTGSGTLNYVPKWTPNGNTLDNSSIFDNGTNVGIGTIAPSSKLDVRGTLTVSNSSAQYVRIGNTYNNPVLTVTDGSTLNSPPGYLNGGYGYYSMGISANSFFNPGSGVWSNPVITTSPSWAAFITSCGNACSFPGDNFTIRRAPPVSGAPVWSDFFTINAAGNVGIGITGPTAKLEISQVASDAGGNGLTITGTGTGAQNWQWYPSSNQSLNLMRPGLRLVRFGNDGSFSAGGLSNDGGAGADFFVNGTSGNVGIGTTSPLGNLDVVGSSGAANFGTGLTGILRVGTSYEHIEFGYVTGSRTWIQGFGAVPLYINEGGNNVILNSGGGNVGIGTTAPSTQLHTTAGVRFQTLTGTGNRFVITDLDGNISAGSGTGAGIVTGSGTLNYLPKWTPNGATLGNSLIFDNGTNVGIGTTNPGEKLHVNGQIIFEDATATSKYGVGRFDHDGLAVTGLFANDGYGSAAVSLGFMNGASTKVPRLTIRQNGNVGIGTTVPAYKLSISGTGAVRNEIIGTDAGSTAGIYLRSNGNGGGATIRDNNKDLEFFTSTAGQVVTIKDGGNVGIGTSSPDSKLSVNGVASVGTGEKLSLIGLDINSGGTPTFIKILTNIPSASGSADFTVNIKGFRYGSAEMINLTIGWHWYNNTFWNPSVSSSGSWAPLVRLSAEGGKVAIVLSGPGYWPKLYVESLFSSAYNDLYSSGWSWADADASGSPIVTVPYKSNFGNNFVMLSNGNVGIGTTSPQSPLHIYTPTIAAGTKVTALRLGSLYADGLAKNAITFWGSTDTDKMSEVVNGWDGSGSYLGIHTRGTLGGNADNNTTEKMRVTSAGNVGIGTTSPSAKLEIAGQIKITGGAPGAGKVLTSDAAGLATWNAASTGTVMGSGTLNYVPKWTPDGNTLGNSSIFDNGNVGVGTTSPSYKLDVVGAIRSSASNIGTLNLGTDSYSSTYITSQVIGQTSPSYTSTGKLSFKVLTWGVGSDYGPTEQMYIDVTGPDTKTATLVMLPWGGNVGIRTVSPGAYGLNVAGNRETRLNNLRLGNNDGSNPADDRFEFSWSSGVDAYMRSKQNVPLRIQTNNGASELTLAANGNVGIGTTNPVITAALDVSSTTKGFLPPRMTTAQRNAISSPAEGLTIYNYDTKCLEFYNGTFWASACQQADGGTQANAAKTCKTILDAGFSTGNGLYWIDPNGGSTNDAFQCYCDMTTDGGGWTLVLLNSPYSTPPKPTWVNITSTNSVTGNINGGLNAFDQFLGVNYWGMIGTYARVEVGASFSSISNRAYYTLTLNAGNNYALSMSAQNITIGGTSPGIYSYHAANNFQLSTLDAVNSGCNCPSYYGNTAWWYGCCWSGSFWGGGDSGSYQNKPFWDSSGGDYREWGAIWLR